jgi:hypothetical protein
VAGSKFQELGARIRMLFALSAFSGSPIFDEMFTLPQSGTPDGTDNEHPLKLEGVTAEEFRPFARAASSQYVLAVKAQTSY